jgi:hypothetical protein
MQKPDEEPFVPYPNRIPPDSFGTKTGKSIRNAGLKTAAFFKRTTAALQGDEAAKEELANSAANVVVKTGDALETAGKAAGDIIDKADKKITQAREKKAKPPTP